MRLPILRKNDFNLWLSEYQRNYQHPHPRKNPPTPGWVPLYHAQLKRKAERENGAKGGGHCQGSSGGKASGGQDEQYDDDYFHQCYRNRRHCYSGLHPPESDQGQYPPYDSTAHQQETTASATQGQGQEDAGYGGPTLQDFSGGSPWSSNPTGSDPTLQMRAIKEKKRQRSDSGLTNLSIALCLWKKNDAKCLRPFSLLPWQQQVAQTTLEARAYAGVNTSRRIY